MRYGRMVSGHVSELARTMFSSMEYSAFKVTNNLG